MRPSLQAASPSRPPDPDADGGTQSPPAAGLRPTLPSVHESPLPQQRRPAGRPAWQPGCATAGRFCTPARAGLRGLALRAVAAARPSHTPIAPTGSAREAAAALGSTLKRLAFRDASPTVAARGGEATAATPIAHTRAGTWAEVGMPGRHGGTLARPGDDSPSSLWAQQEAMQRERDAGLARLKRELVEARGRAARQARRCGAERTRLALLAGTKPRSAAPQPHLRCYGLRYAHALGISDAPEPCCREREAQKLARLERAVAGAGRESHPVGTGVCTSQR